MQTDVTVKNVCKSVFQNPSEAAISKNITQKWIELINRQEAQKNISSARQT